MASTANSRFGILNWINDTLLLNLQKIEQLGSGNVYCQLLDAAYPERVPLYKVKWDARLETDFLHNFKILQASFEFLGLEKRIEVDIRFIQIQKLCKAKYQDNL